MRLDHPLRGQLVALIDLETTGTDRSARIIEIGIVLVDLMESEPLVFLDQLVDPQIPIPWSASNVHGLYDRDVRGKPLWREVWPKVRALLEEGAIPCAYNAVFDARILRQENERLGLDGSIPERTLWLDPFPLVKRMDPKRHRLMDACDRRGIPRGGHRATTDAIATARLLRRLIVEAYTRDDLSPAPPRHPSLRQWLAWQSARALPRQLFDTKTTPTPSRTLRPPPSSKARSSDAWSKISGSPRTREGHPVCRYCAGLHPKPRHLIYTREDWGTLEYDAPCIYCGSSCAGNRWGATKPRVEPSFLDLTGRPPVRRRRGLAALAAAAPETSIEAEGDA